MIPTIIDFQKELDEILNDAKKQNLDYIDVSSGEIHRRVGSYPGPNHRMPMLCDVLRKMMGSNDKVIKEPPSGQGIIVIRYFLNNKSEIIKKFENVGRSEEQIRKEISHRRGGDRLYFPNFEKEQTTIEKILWGILGGGFLICLIILLVILLN